MDVATKLRVLHPLYLCDFLEMRAESGNDFIHAMSERWLCVFPRPRVVILDSAKSFMSEQVSDFLSDLQGSGALCGREGAMGEWHHRIGCSRCETHRLRDLPGGHGRGLVCDATHVRVGTECH